MNGIKLSALFRDALYQVLDNWVFRILVVLTGIVVLFTFALGFRENEIVLLFGVERWSYDGIFQAFDAPSQKDPQGILIGALTGLIFDQVVGKFGVMFCIAATAFFVPRMIEKGAADVLFHKPVSRLVFYLHRYLVGLLFVGILSSIMALGIYAGLAIASGWHDPGVLLAAPLLTYVFGLVYAVTMWIGVVTRSTVAAILLSIVFFAVNGCVHLTWHAFGAGAQVERLEREKQDEGDLDSDEAFEEDETPAALRYFVDGITYLHYVLPKTGDAAVLASKVRRAAEAPPFLDETELVAVFDLPDGFEVLEPTAPSVPADVTAAFGDPVYAFEGSIAPDEEDAWAEASVRATLLARPIRELERTRRGEVITRPETLTQAGSLLKDAVEDAGLGDVRSSLTSFGSNPNAQTFGGTRILTWEDEEERLTSTHALVFKGMSEERIFTLWVEDGTTEPTEERRLAVDEELGQQMGVYFLADPYQAKFTFDAPWRYNIFFSVGSSLAFVLVFLLLGWWKLSRIDF